jgi:hypothetical protein
VLVFDFPGAGQTWGTGIGKPPAAERRERFIAFVEMVIRIGSQRHGVTSPWRL